MYGFGTGEPDAPFYYYDYETDDHQRKVAEDAAAEGVAVDPSGAYTNAASNAFIEAVAQGNDGNGHNLDYEHSLQDVMEDLGLITKR